MPEDKVVISDVDVVGRCKQCGQPVTQFNKVKGPTGMFCSESCRERHESFVKKAASSESKQGGGFGIKYKLKRLISWIVTIVVLAAVIGGFALFFEIPVLTPLVRRILGQLGF